MHFMDIQPVISLKNLTKQYGNFTAVSNLNLDIPRGEVFGFLGPNGAGKSTTLRMMLSLITPTSGEITILGKNLFKEREAILRNVGCIIEKPDFYLYLSAWDNLRMFAQMSGINPSKKLMEQTFELVGLTGRERDTVKAYSHGMKQRLGLAQALIHNPELVILDEPTTGLDPQGIIDLRNIILMLKNEKGKTVVLSSHILSEIELIADSMTIISKGKALVQGKVGQLLSNEDLLVSIEAVDKKIAKQVISTSVWQQYYSNDEDTRLVFKMAKEQIPAFNNYLDDNGVKLYSLNYKRTLEDYFLKLTH
jgi:ABC-type multidrug transport system ATPase subunit